MLLKFFLNFEKYIPIHLLIGKGIQLLPCFSIYFLKFSKNKSMVFKSAIIWLIISFFQKKAVLAIFSKR